MEEFLPIQLMPILMRGRACRIDASGATESTATTTSSLLGGLIGLVGPIGAVESNGSPQSRLEEFYSNTTGLEGLFRHLNRCC